MCNSTSKFMLVHVLHAPKWWKTSPQCNISFMNGPKEYENKKSYEESTIVKVLLWLPIKVYLQVDVFYWICHHLFGLSMANWSTAVSSTTGQGRNQFKSLQCSASMIIQRKQVRTLILFVNHSIRVGWCK